MRLAVEVEGLGRKARKAYHISDINPFRFVNSSNVGEKSEKMSVFRQNRDNVDESVRYSTVVKRKYICFGFASKSEKSAPKMCIPCMQPGQPRVSREEVLCG